MSPSTGALDRTTFTQGLMNMVKGNLGTGILAMPMSFKHCGLITSAITLPFLCLVCTFCVHLLVRSSQHLETKMKWTNLDYASVAKGAFKSGPRAVRAWSGSMCRVVDVVLLVSQLGICCIYLVFIVDNIEKIIAQPSEFVASPTTNTTGLDSAQEVAHANHVPYVPKSIIFLCVLPFVLLISYIRTLNRLAISSACANMLQLAGITIILVNLIKGMPSHAHTQNFTSLAETALGFGSAMFAFEGISVVLPTYTRMESPEEMGGSLGLINCSYVILLVLYCTVGTLGYLVFGEQIRDSITLNLPPDAFNHAVRAAFTTSIFLTYPLQFYVPNEIIWNYSRARFLGATKVSQDNDSKLEYVNRTVLVVFTFALAMSVPRLNLLMDLVGSIAGTLLCVTLPAIIHLVTFWDDVSGGSKVLMVLIDSVLILFSIIASTSGSLFSMIAIYESF